MFFILPSKIRVGSLPLQSVLERASCGKPNQFFKIRVRRQSIHPICAKLLHSQNDQSQLPVKVFQYHPATVPTMEKNENN